MALVGLSRRAIRDLEQIQQYSRDRWGQRVADDYMDGIEDALARLRERPELLRARPSVSGHFKFYRVREHFLVCVQQDDRIYILTIKQTSMDLPQRLIDLEPQLLLEVNLLHDAFLASKRQ